MSMTKDHREEIHIPEISAKPLLLFWRRGRNGVISWSLREHIAENVALKVWRPSDLPSWTLDAILNTARQRSKAKVVHTHNLAYWHERLGKAILEKN